MKIKTVRSFLLIAIATIVAGCATTGIDTRATITDSDYNKARGKHRSEIDIFIDDSPSRAYLEVGTIKALGIDKSKKENLVEAMKIRAAKIGVDGITNISFSSEAVTGGPTGGLFCPTWKECRYLGGDSMITSRPTASGTAIVYTETPEAVNPLPAGQAGDSELGKAKEDTEKKKGPE